jgi:hypothetical protein
MGFHGGAWNAGGSGLDEGMSIAMEARGYAKHSEQYQYNNNNTTQRVHSSKFSNSNKAQVEQEASLQKWKHCSQPLLDGGQGKNIISGQTSQRTRRAARRVRESGFSVDGMSWATGAKGGDVIRVQQQSKINSSKVDVTPPLKPQGQCVMRAGGPDELSPGGSASSSAKGYFPGGTVSSRILTHSRKLVHMRN